jgi:hypothetical protein
MKNLNETKALDYLQSTHKVDIKNKTITVNQPLGIKRLGYVDYLVNHLKYSVLFKTICLLIIGLGTINQQIYSNDGFIIQKNQYVRGDNIENLHVYESDRYLMLKSYIRGLNDDRHKNDYKYNDNDYYDNIDMEPCCD